MIGVERGAHGAIRRGAVEILEELPDIIQRQCVRCREWWPDDGEFYLRHFYSGLPMAECLACNHERANERKWARRRGAAEMRPSRACGGSFLWGGSRGQPPAYCSAECRRARRAEQDREKWRRRSAKLRELVAV